MNIKSHTEKHRKITANLNQSLQDVFAGLFLVVEICLHMWHQDAVSAVKLNVRPPEKQKKRKDFPGKAFTDINVL